MCSTFPRCLAVESPVRLGRGLIIELLHLTLSAYAVRPFREYGHYALCWWQLSILSAVFCPNATLKTAFSNIPILLDMKTDSIYFACKVQKVKSISYIGSNFIRIPKTNFDKPNPLFKTSFYTTGSHNRFPNLFNFAHLIS